MAGTEEPWTSVSLFIDIRSVHILTVSFSFCVLFMCVVYSLFQDAIGEIKNRDWEINALGERFAIAKAGIEYSQNIAFVLCKMIYMIKD